MASFQHLWIIGKMLVHVSRDNTSSTGSSVGSFSSHDFVNTIFTHSLHKKLRLLYDVNIWCTFCQFSFCRLQTVRQILWNTDQEVWQTRAGHCGLWRFHPVLCGAPGQWLKYNKIALFRWIPVVLNLLIYRITSTYIPY